MAKRKRLSPAQLDDTVAPLHVTADAAQDATPDHTPAQPLETKSMFPSYPSSVYQPRRAPIADVAGDAATTAAFQELADTLHAARQEGRMIQRLPLDAVDETYLVRDRMVVEADEMRALCDSLRARGQQTAIEVVDLGEGRWGLIAGWRRLMALRHLRDAAGEGAAETGETGETEKFDTVLAISRQPEEAADAYLAMVEENEIRVGLSYYERARIVARAVDKGVFRADRIALPALFHAASRAKRSKIGSFVRIVRALDPALRFPAALTERTGLTLAAALDADPGLENSLAAVLTQAAPKTAEAEARVIAGVLRAEKVSNTTAGTTTPPQQVAPHAPQRMAETPRVGLLVTTRSDGRLVMSGPVASDPDFRARLMDWLRGN
jgi:ParB family transcriptional regulator, chromosome partitioning protein